MHRMWAMAIVLLPATAALADPLSDAIGGKAQGICYKRNYSAEHLAKNPDQLTHSIQLSLAPHPEGRGALARLAIADAEGEVYSIGECFWNASAGLGDDGKPYTATFKGGPGLDCTARASPNWAWEEEVKEGGLFVVDMRDGKSMTIHTQDEIAAWPQLNRDAPAGFYPLGPDDRIFRVDRVTPDNCMEMVDLLGWDGN
ncbi:MAG: hypothetical protein KF849_07950 [Rhizobiaceae bacterium]|nr:hypothetical protein [Rhizobiaceae bacterium]